MNPRKSNRLKGHDYSKDGYYYFVTVCVKGRAERLGIIKNGEMVLNRPGKIVLECWNNLPDHYPNVELDAFVVMPNHLHGIIFIAKPAAIRNVVGGGLKPPPTTPDHGLPEIIRGFKTFSSRKINEMNVDDARFQWQRSYHDAIIRTNESLEKIREYIGNNPSLWDRDPEHVHSQMCGIA